MWRKRLHLGAETYVRRGGRREAVLPELAEIRAKLALDHTLGDAYLRNAYHWKAEELKPEPELEGNWSDKKSHLRRVGSELAKREGFNLTRTGYQISVTEDLSIDVEIDVGWPGSTIRQIVMYNRLWSKGTGWEMNFPWDDLAPGIRVYMNGMGPATMVWGLKAFITIGKEFAATLRGEA